MRISRGPHHPGITVAKIPQAHGALAPRWQALSWLERRGWVRPLVAGERRRPYEITAAGQEILAEQVTTVQQIVRVARLRTAMAWGP